MIVLKAFVTAGPDHPTFAAGSEVQAHIAVDSADWADAESRAAARLSELGWQSPRFEGAISLPDNPDLSHVSSQLREAVGLAKDLGVALVVYPRAA